MRVRGLMLQTGLAVGLVLSGVAGPVWADDVDGDGVDDAVDVCDNTPTGTAVDVEGRPLGDVDLDCDTDLEDHGLFQRGFTGALVPTSVVIATIPVGNPGNANDTHGDGYGGVDYEYDIGKYEVTAGQYTVFLNAVAATDTYGLYDSSMWSNSCGCKIERAGSPPNYTYSVAVDWADRPVNYVSWGDAARFANWLHNGQPRGAQDLTTTEDGSYFLDGATSSAALIAVVREPDATWVIPSEDEWYKAAYHKNDGVTGNYYDYPTSSDSVPASEACPGGNNSANYYGGEWAVGPPYYRNPVGCYVGSASPYGTFDQGGNVFEWTEDVLYGSYRGVRGGSFNYYGGELRAADRNDNNPSYGDYYIGFRVAEVP